MADLRAAVGHRVRGLRKRLKISQEDLAERADLHRNYVGSVERGERDVGILSVSRLAAALGLSLAEFFAPFTKVTRR
jgi:transcriptional regulator with XRE-family HTH domain